MSSDIQAFDFAALRAVAEAATPGPWVADALGSEGYAVREAVGSPRPGSRIPRPVRVARCGYEDWDTDKANAQFIATFDPPTVLGVLDALDEVQQTIERVAAVLGKARCAGCFEADHPCGRDDCALRDRVIAALLPECRYTPARGDQS